ncbi:hypothetical protein [Novosphingobium sp.]
MNAPDPSSDKSGVAALLGTGIGMVALLCVAIGGAAVGVMMMMH